MNNKDEIVGDLIGEVVTAALDDVDTTSSSSSHQAQSQNQSSSSDVVSQPVMEELVRYISTQYQTFLKSKDRSSSNSTFIIGMTGGVSVGKSTLAKHIKELLTKVEYGSLTTTVLSSDGFLKSNKQLESESLSHRKGFPESYDIDHIRRFLSNVRDSSAVEEGKSSHSVRTISVPEYDHLIYDVKPDPIEIELPHILLFEGVNVLQFAEYCDLTIYVDAQESFMRHWFMTRVIDLRKKSATDPSAEFYRQFASMTDEEFYHFAEGVWESINLRNLVDYIEPMKEKADIVVEKEKDHSLHRLIYRSKA